ncbi:hypothetical protein EI94DRAFT_1035559 [Lactarius quietus]|nr:hypothetical protein EI94DRAFT_1035559 [Lactarius quietus]
MVRARHRRPPSPPPPPPPPPQRRRPMMSAGAHRFRTQKPKKRPPPWRKPEDVELREEIRDLERDIACHSEGAKGASDQNQAQNEQPGAQEPCPLEEGHSRGSQPRDPRPRARHRNPAATTGRHAIGLRWKPRSLFLMHRKPSSVAGPPFHPPRSSCLSLSKSILPRRPCCGRPKNPEIFFSIS